jgi:hypothetical protein
LSCLDWVWTGLQSDGVIHGIAASNVASWNRNDDPIEIAAFRVTSEDDLELC